MRWIYLSPHLDDAVFSAGGLIYEQTQAGIPVEIWTFMCGYASEGDVSPFAQLLHAQWGAITAGEATSMRRAEDQSAAAILGASSLHFDFLDCIYRRAADGEWLYSDVFLPPRPEDAGIPSQIAETLSAHLREDDIVVCQLALGSHVDHVLVREGAALLGRPLLYDIDLPYIFYHPEELEQKSAGMKESIHFITEAGVNHWKRAAVEYKSQLGTLGEAFDTPETAQASIQAYWAERGGIRILQRSE
jgi:LmbE family N-acetylglucosaminyl deacetylase